MAFLNQIATKINDTLKASIFTGHLYQGAKWFGLAETIKRESGSGYDYVVAQYYQDNITECNIDDTYPMVVYHRHLGSSFEKASNADFGDTMRMTTETADMMMIVYGDRKRLQITPDTLASGISANIPLSLTNTELTNLSLSFCEMRGDGVSFDKDAIWRGEYQTNSNPLGIEKIYFALKYSVELHYSNGCFNICFNC